MLKTLISFACWVKPKLANIVAGFLAYYSLRATKKKHHATAIRTKRSTSGCIYTVGTQSVKDKAFRGMRAVKSSCPGILTAIICAQQIRAMSACFGWSRGDLESEYPHGTAVISCWCSILKSCSRIVSVLFFPIPYLSLHYSRPPSQ